MNTQPGESVMARSRRSALLDDRRSDMEEDAEAGADRLLDVGAEAGEGRDSDVVVVDDDWFDCVVEGVIVGVDIVVVEGDWDEEEEADGDWSTARIVGKWLTDDSDGPASWPSPPVRRPLPALMVRRKLW